VTPRQVVYRAADGVAVHAQLFERPGGAGKKPAVVFRAPDGTEVHGQRFQPAGRAAGERGPAIVYVHGGPPRQMLLGWHYSDYYANAYAMNPYLASEGYAVLSVNYRLGIGYGFDFHRAPNAGAQGAAEYRDVKAGGEWLRAQPWVDPTRIGIYGGSYGGYLTALALARDSRLFAAGVDVHGVHDFTAEGGRRFGGSEWRYEKTDRDSAAAVAWRSSPVASIATWRSPVLLVHGDDDRNVRFSTTVDLAQRLSRAGVRYEELVLPDETHHLMRHANSVLVTRATAEFFGRTLGRSVSLRPSPR
jgi:dipeptidyl aminopeptidase/acylaminoacyl peptidase